MCWFVGKKKIVFSLDVVVNSRLLKREDFIWKYGQEDHNRSEAENHWILPDLATLGTASSRKISSFLQDLSNASKNNEFKRSIVPRLPEDVSGNSLRVGSINEAVAKNVPVQSVILHGGHEMHGYSASWEYDNWPLKLIIFWCIRQIL